MAALEVIALDTSVPQLMAPQAGDTYTFPRAVEMPLNTANGVLYLNGSKVVTSGSALTFDGTTQALAAASGYGVYRVSGASGGYLDTYNSSGTKIGSFGSENGGDMYLGTRVNNPMIFLQNGSEQMRLTSTGLGIGTSSPAYKLDVVGNTRFSSTSMINQFNLAANGTGTYTNLRITNSSSTAELSIGVGGSAVGAASLQNNAYVWNTAASSLSFGTNDTERMRLDSSGNLGLGVTPSAWGASWRALELPSGVAYTSAFGVNYQSTNAYHDGTNWIYKTSSVASFYQNGAGSHSWHVAPSGTAGNAISFSQVMTLDASGNLSVGRTTPITQITFSGSDGITYQRSTDNTFSGVLDYLKSRGSAASPTAVQNGDDLFTLRVAPYHGSAYTYLTNTVVQVDGTFTSGQNPPTRITWYTNAANGSPTERARITSGGSLVVGTAALATTATDGFLYVPTCAGTPTGTPTTQTGTAPIVVDTTNNKLYFYSGGQWRDAGP